MKLMSKPFKPIFFAWLVFVEILQFLNNSPAQSLEIRVKIEGSEAKVSGRIVDIPDGIRFNELIFADTIAGQSHYRLRVRDIRVVRRSYESGKSGIDSFEYVMDLRPPGLASMAHASWIDGERGVLAAADLFPNVGANLPVNANFELPAGWKFAFGIPNRTLIKEPEREFFFISKNPRESEVAGGIASVVVDGEFKFTDADAVKMVAEIIGQYRSVFGGMPREKIKVIIARFPEDAREGRFEAETRGSTVLIMSADLPNASQSAQRLHAQLRHELFHLWMPNALELDGAYDWFYEGFALYQSLRTAVALNRIRFEDFLGTLGRAYDADSKIVTRHSLIDASRDRWSGFNTRVYARGMLVGFLIDVEMLARSKGKRSVSDLLRTIWKEHGSGSKRADGNEAVIAAIEKYSELKPIVSSYIRGSAPIEWRTALAAAGIEAVSDGSSTTVRVITAPTKSQKDLLDKLGYNNWRNFLKKSQ